MKVSSRSDLQVVRFSLGAETFGVDILRVKDIIRHMTITRVPGAPAGVEGVVNLRGRILPVVDLRNKLGLESHPIGASTRIIVIELDSGITGFIVDEVRKVMIFDVSVVEPAPEMARGIDTEYIRGVAKLEEELIILIDFDRVMGSAECSKIAA